MNTGRIQTFRHDNKSIAVGDLDPDKYEDWVTAARRIHGAFGNGEYSREMFRDFSRSATKNYGLSNSGIDASFCQINNIGQKEVKRTTAIDLLGNGKSILEERAREYDSPQGERSMGKVATAFTAITGKHITESEAWLIMAILKMVRDRSTLFGHTDSIADLVNYAALYGEARHDEMLLGEKNPDLRAMGLKAVQVDNNFEIVNVMTMTPMSDEEKGKLIKHIRETVTNLTVPLAYKSAKPSSEELKLFTSEATRMHNEETMDGEDRAVALNRVIWVLAQALGKTNGKDKIECQISTLVHEAAGVIMLTRTRDPMPFLRTLMSVMLDNVRATFGPAAHYAIYDEVFPGELDDIDKPELVPQDKLTRMIDAMIRRHGPLLNQQYKAPTPAKKAADTTMPMSSAHLMPVVISLKEIIGRDATVAIVRNVGGRPTQKVADLTPAQALEVVKRMADAARGAFDTKNDI